METDEIFDPAVIPKLVIANYKNKHTIHINLSLPQNLIITCDYCFINIVPNRKNKSKNRPKFIFIKTP